MFYGYQEPEAFYDTLDLIAEEKGLKSVKLTPTFSNISEIVVPLPSDCTF